MKKQHKGIRIAAKVAEWCTVLGATAWAYTASRAAAVAFRGNTAYGGELCVLALPLIYAAVRSIIRDLNGEKIDNGDEKWYNEAKQGRKE